MYVQAMPEDGAAKAPYHLLDMTKIWPYQDSPSAPGRRNRVE